MKLRQLHLYVVLLHVVVLLQVLVAEKTKCPLLKATGASESERTGCYIIVLNSTTSPETFQDVQSKVIEMSEDAKIYGSVQKVIKAFTVNLSEIALEAVS